MSSFGETVSGTENSAVVRPPELRTPVVTREDGARVDRYLRQADFRPSSVALSVPCRVPQDRWLGEFLGAEQAAFADEFTKVHGKGIVSFFSIPVSNGSRAISLALKAVSVHARRLGIREPRIGDNVIVPALTWPATATAALEQGFVPRLADVDEDTLCMDPISVARLVDSRTFAIIAVHLYNRVADMAALGAVARDNGLALIEDCAHAHGAQVDGHPAGTIGHAGTFSLQASKTLTCGEGGIVTTRDRWLAEQVASQANSGRSCGRAIAIPSSNDRMPGLSAAFARSQLTRFDEQHETRRRTWNRLDEVAADLKGVEPLASQPNTISPNYKWAARYPLEHWADISLDDLAAALTAELDVEVTRIYEPLTESPLYRPLNDPFLARSASSGEMDPTRYECPSASILYRSVLAVEHGAALVPHFPERYAAAVRKIKRDVAGTV